ncbi:MAG: Gldg family protein [Oscillospiraceae bacterium]|nr:Gldg family protein [Oscillospiraceae bacterium]
MKKNEQKSKLTVRAGSYSLVLCVVVIALVIVLNVLVNLLPVNITTPDVSTMQLYDFTDETEEMIKNLDEDITVYFWRDDSVGNYTYIEQFLERFSALNSGIKVKDVYPDRDPNFIYNYVEEGKEPPTNSLVFVSDKRFKIVNYSDMFTYSDKALQYIYSMLQYGISAEEALASVAYDVFAAENAVVNAVDYVTTDELPVVYLLRGHGESDLGNSVNKQTLDANYTVVKMEEGQSLLALEAVPEDANCVIINNPTSDLTEDEFDKLMAYMERGGSIIFLTDMRYDATACPTFAKLCEAYGLEAVPGLVLETSGNYMTLPFNIIASKGPHEITNPLISAGSYVYAPMAHGIKKIDSYRSSLEFSTLIETSNGAYAKIVDESLDSYDKAEGDAEGPFMMGVIVEEAVGEAETSRFVWYSSSVMLNDQYLSDGAMNLYLNTLAYGSERVDTITVRTITLTNSNLEMSAAAGMAWTVILVAVIPILLIAAGFVVWFVRRMRK